MADELSPDVRRILEAVAVPLRMLWEDDYGSRYCIFGCDGDMDNLDNPRHESDCPVSLAQAIVGRPA